MTAPLPTHDHPVTVTLTPAEWRLVCALREVPEGHLKHRVAALLDDVVRFVRDPHCGEQQADGVPCTNVKADCDVCPELDRMVDQVVAAHPLETAPKG